MDWRLKASVQFVVSRLPGAPGLNRMFQDLRNRDPIPELRTRIVAVARELAWAEANGLRFEGARLLELGTGRTPVATLLSSLLGASVYSYDRFPLADEKHTRLICEQVVDLSEELARILGRAPSQLRIAKTWIEQPTLDELFGASRIIYRAPGDATASELLSHSMDAVVSFDVIEHLPRPTLGLLNQEARRILKPGGFQFHAIGLGDHFASLDPKITSAHFLKYSEGFWQFLTGNCLSYHNRIRLPEFLRLFEENGFGPVAVDREIDPRAVEALRTQPIARPFRAYSLDELAAHRAKVLFQQKSVHSRERKN